MQSQKNCRCKLTLIHEFIADIYYFDERCIKVIAVLSIISVNLKALNDPTTKPIVCLNDPFI
jgi:hypothetical protein